MSTPIRKRRDFQSGVFLFFFGLFLALESIKLSFWSREGPGEGFFPLAVAIIVIGLSIILVMKSLFPLIARENIILENPEIKKVNSRKVISYAVFMVLLSILMQTGGFLMTSSVFFIFICKYVEKESWKTTALAAFTCLMGFYILFILFLKVPLPQGFILSLILRQ